MDDVDDDDDDSGDDDVPSCGCRKDPCFIPHLNSHPAGRGPQKSRVPNPFTLVFGLGSALDCSS